MKTQTKCTLSLCGMLIIEILPIPLTSLISMYAVRKRPAWLPGVVKRLYADKETTANAATTRLNEDEAMTTRRRCTLSLSVMILMDFLIPFTIFTGLYITRRRPQWFSNVVNKLYADQPITAETKEESLNNRSSDKQAIEDKYIALQKSNMAFAMSVANKIK